MDQLVIERVRPHDLTTWPDSLRRTIMDQYEQGFLIGEIAKRFQLDAAEVGRFLRRQGVDTKTNATSRALVEPDPTPEEIKERAAAIRRANIAKLPAYEDSREDVE